MTQQQTKEQNVPAGFFGNGIEPFYYDSEKWVLAFGVLQRFDTSSSAIQQPIWRAFLNDKQSLEYMATKMGLKKATETFERWYQCVVGGLDNIPDVLGQKFTPDAFNNLCTNSRCEHRGKLCGRLSGLKTIDVETIQALKAARNMEHAAETIHISLPAMKSRVEKLHVKMNVNNSISMMAHAVQLGI